MSKKMCIDTICLLYYLIIVFEKNQAQDKPPRSNSIPDNLVHYKQIKQCHQYTV